jgi:V/A-type H+-transporting ATPase subunit C
MCSVPDFPYINARVRAMRSQLLDAARMEELLGLPTLDALLQSLGSTPYARELQESLSRTKDGVRGVDEALARNFSRTANRIVGFADGKAKDLIEFVLVRWDMTNVRIILRAKHAGRNTEEIVANLIPVGRLNEPALKEVAAQPDVAGVVGALGGLDHPLAAPLAEGLAAYQKSGDLLDLELRMDRFYGAYGLRVARGRGHDEQVVRRLLQDQLDATNVRTAVMLQQVESLSREDKLKFFIPGGRLTEHAFLLLTDRATVEQGLRVVRVLGFPVSVSADDPAAFEREIDVTLLRAQIDLYLQDPLGIDVVIAYFAMKYHEVANLRLIARRKAVGIPRERVRKEMALV